MYTIFLDKTENFECNLQLEGASLKKSTCRLVIESPEITVLCTGDIQNDGKVSIPIKKLKNIIEEHSTGTLQLEVIADGETYFVPWQDEFEAKYSKKVTVEVKSNNKKSIVEEKQPIKPKASVSLTNDTKKNLSKNEIKKCLTECGKIIVEQDINLQNLKSHADKFALYFHNLKKNTEITKEDKSVLLENILKMIERRTK